MSHNIHIQDIGYLCVYTLFQIFGAFSKLRKATVSFFIYLCPSIHPRETCGCHWNNFNKICYLNIFRKSVKKIQVSLKSDKENGDFT